ncbi:hypothetical protein [Schinkia azotoformans]|nr:hypothetical protein [Schinkia azotoformans]MEC1715927.1 hypothetical protein [Schinkia azotoformans]MEC1741566.1 hypothetical protein [Schinkia azotoformans]MEC1744560.1 hypothetical protein [Schinkia azotoformans]MEC1758449.1 hypothetical protein [Schinkia azotoformans]MEC1765251.1 hypothetical protein [Schinkia azotoformans]
MKNNYFFCYDFNMQKYLSNNHEYITHARSIKSGREFWLFLKSDSLQKSIDEFILKKNDVKNNMA